MINRLFHSKKQQNPLTDRIVWGIWAPKRLKLTYKMMAASLRVPISVLVIHVLTQWIIKHGERLTNDKVSRQQYGDYLSQKYMPGIKQTRI